LDTVVSATVDTRARRFETWLERGLLFWLFLLAGFAPHSIAVTQIAWGVGLLFWIVRLCVKPRPRLYRTPVDYFLLGFFILSTISSMLSYDPETSIGKLRAASLFTIVYLVAENLKGTKWVKILGLTLVGSCLISVVYAAGERIVGRGVKPRAVAASGALSRAGLREGDTILEVNGEKAGSPDEIVAKITVHAPARSRLKLYRYELFPEIEVGPNELPAGNSALERLGAGTWSRGRDWREAGFYGHYITYAESLQLIASLAVGLFVALNRKWSLAGALLAITIGALCFSLLLTVTRGATLAFLISSTVIVLLGASRKLILVLGVCAIPLVVGGLFLLQQKRNVSFLDSRDESINWRKTVQREGFRVLTESPRHMLVGVGMDSIKRHGVEWGIFKNGIPLGHMHSDYLQIALERGLPALLVWLALMFAYGRMLWRLLHKATDMDWIERGITLGAFGGLIGFLASGVVHYNWGDSEVVMIFFLIMALTIVLDRERQIKADVRFQMPDAS
jgi:O-Antigen ligase/PDZ domain